MLGAMVTQVARSGLIRAPDSAIAEKVKIIVDHCCTSLITCVYNTPTQRNEPLGSQESLHLPRQARDRQGQTRGDRSRLGEGFFKRFLVHPW